jgi:hypothetical protein
MSVENPPKYICEICNYFTLYSKDYNRHILTKKHKGNITANLSNKIATEKSAHKHYCKKCNYYTSDVKDYNKHIQTKKHICNNISKNYICENCNKIYINRSGLWRHKKICVSETKTKAEDEEETKIKIKEEATIKEETTIKEENECLDIGEIKLLSHMFLQLVKQNTEFKELLVEQNKQTQNLQFQFIELAKEKTMNNCHNITNNNNQFNLNLFLNETCKNAMNISEFVEQIPIKLSDLEDTARLGYVEGISRIFIRSLKELEVNERPIHCSDAKRETLYIKEGDVWEKDDSNKSKLTNAIRKVGTKNIRMITEWKKKYPDCEDYYSNKNDLYLSIVNNAMCGGTEEETLSNYNKIRKNIIKQVIIPK